MKEGIDKGLPTGWASVRLGDLVHLEYGKSLVKSTRVEAGKFCVFGSSGVVGLHDRFLVEGPAIIVGRKGAAGSVHYSAENCWPIDTTYFIRGSQYLLAKFSYYLLRSLNLERLEASTAIPGLNRDQAHDEIVLLPPLGEQNRIVTKIEELFSELDKGAESLKTAQAQLKVYRQALLKHAFEGKLTAQWRADNPDKLETAAALQQRIARERQARYQQQLADWQTAGQAGPKPKTPKPLPPLTAEELAELPELPVGWGWMKYGDLCSLVRNGISAKPEGDSGTPIFRISAVRPMCFDMADIRYIDNSSGEFDAYRLERGDLVFTRYNGSRQYVGVCAEYRSDEKRLFPDKLVQTRVSSRLLLTSFLEKALNSGASRAFVESKIRTTAGQSGVSGEDIKNIPVPVCCLVEQLEIVQELESKLSEADQLELTLTTALQQSEALRQSILKKAFSGQLVPQDPTDEPAASLLARIKAEQSAAPKAKKARK